MPTPIAIVGSACRFPGESTTPSKLFDLLRQPRDVRREFNPEILNLQQFYDSDPDAPGSTNVKNKGYLLAEDTRVFDASFFNVSPHEAESMDPQLRVTLETVYEAFESAGFTLDQMRGSKTSVHVGSMTSDYWNIQNRDPETMPQYAGSGVARSILSNRISYTFDLHGPSITLDTACSSSLVALHQAVQGIQAGDATCAVVCGVCLILDPTMYVMLSKLHMLSPDSLSRMWDKSVDGYARGEGAAVVVLKPLDQALRDNDYIEAIIRGTGVNSDGQSPGLTMPTVDAQAALIRETYQRAGLDPIRDRCQYFECHGTGTPAGDPVESRAIYEAMIRDRDPLSPDPTTPLYVGSIKTLIGHLEGCAGLAGILKALLSLKHRTIFPNLLFNELNPNIEPYYNGFQVPTSPLAWPELRPGEPLRVSVNSFGFGGTNAHAILENHDHEPVAVAEVSQVLSPFVLSGHSASSLLGNCQALLKYLKDNPSTDLSNLSWTLQSRRTAHRVRTFSSSQTREGLIQDLENFASQQTSKDDIGIRPRSAEPDKTPRILGVFTGQGAQWPSMGRGLLENSPLFRRALERFDKVLTNLPDGPEWSLIEELSRNASDSRVGEAAISQPLCTAVQLALVEVLRASGISFDTVLGHSSGEIAAVYASGIISAAAAMQIAYYRGKYAHLACGSNAETGGMMAVGIEYDKAMVFCQQPKYQGRVCVAANNAPQSVTLSGDLEAVQDAKEHFEEHNTFARLLKVDTAYHSHHMDHCVASYLESLRACDIKVQPPKDACLWVSSVHGNTQLLEGDLESLQGPYWVQNMVQTVLFAPAIKSAMQDRGPFDLAIEIGPHPSLRGPTNQTLSDAAPPPYIGTLKRGCSDVEALGETIGSVWCHLEPAGVNFDGFRRALAASGDSTTPKLLKDLPPYAWDHERVYWRESRISRNYTKRKDGRHQLLGRRVPDDTERDVRWRNVLRLSQLSWVQGHVVSGEVLLPGASYISLCCEAGKRIAAGRPVRRMEIEDIQIHRPVMVPESGEGVETSFSMRLEESSRDAASIVAHFSYDYLADARLGAMVHAADGKVTVYLGEARADELPPYRVSAAPEERAVDSDASYAMLAHNGLRYSGLFRRLRHVRRNLDYAIATASWWEEELTSCPSYMLHPAVLDVALHNLFNARAEPKAGKLPTTLVPVSIKRVLVNPWVCVAPEAGPSVSVTTESFITARNGLGMVGDVHVYSSATGDAAVQMESVSMEPVAPATEDHDRHFFFDTKYHADPSLRLLEPTHEPTLVQHTRELSADIERAVLVYVQRVLAGLPPSERSALTWYHQRLLDSFEHSLRLVREGRHPVAERAWLDDTSDILHAIFAKWPGQVDLECVRLVGENMLAFLLKKSSMLEVINDLLIPVYTQGCGFSNLNPSIASLLGQIAHKFPRARYLEIGAGTGGTTDLILRTIGLNAFDTYTYTDISPAFFGHAAEKFRDFRGKTIFKTLDIEKDVGPQGFQKHAYDVVVASYVLHATEHLTETLKHAHSLLKPGGFLLLLEITGIEIMRPTFCVGGLPGWWLGANEGRTLHPGLSTEEWHKTLQLNGFSGVDLVFHDDSDVRKHTMSFMATQAVNHTVEQLREPLEYVAEIPELKSLLVIGGKTLAVSKAVSAIQRLLGRKWHNRVTFASDIESVDFSRSGSREDVLFLAELDIPFFSEPITPPRLKALQNIIVTARNVLWVTTKRRTDNPYSNIMLGLARAISKELPHVTIQFLDLDSVASPSFLARIILKTFIRMKILSVQRQDDILWPQEPELIVEGENTLIPRVRPDQRLNDRYNARYRSIRKPARTMDTLLGLRRQQDKLALIKTAPPAHAADTEHALIRVRYSLFIPNEKGKGIYLALGRLIDSDVPVVAVSESNTSIISVLRNEVALINDKDCNTAILEGIADQIMVTALLSPVREGESALLHNPRASLAACFTAEAYRRRLNPVCTSSRTQVTEDWISIHPNSSVRIIQSLLPQHLAVYLDCPASSDSSPTPIQLALPPGCSIHQWDSRLFQRGLNSTLDIQTSLTNAYASLPDLVVNSAVRDALICELDLLNIEDIAITDASILDKSHIVCWETTGPLGLLIQPPDMTALFDSAKTYLMIGMTTGLGISICGWALKHGARHLVITSRKPKIHPNWLAQARRQGAEIHVRSMDAADRASLECTISDIRETLPPLGGVCNAAMVLSDKLFVDMNVDALIETFKPKVDVSKHLDEILADTPLDFFIMLSSCLALIGGHGSGNYHAANLFMTALAAQRRQRRRAASVIHLGWMTDVGYFTRKDKSAREYMERVHMAPLSETDMHHAFAEAILSGKPNSERSCEIGIGIEPFKAHMTEDQQAPWVSDPLFSHYRPTVQVHDTQESPQHGRGDLGKQIQDAETETEVVTVVQGAFCAKIEIMLQLSTGSVDGDTLLTNLGIDSLVAVEIRTWFSKKIGVDIPVMKILGRRSIAQICTSASKEILSTRVERRPKNEDAELESLSDSQDLSPSDDSKVPRSENMTPPSIENETASSSLEDADVEHKTAQHPAVDSGCAARSGTDFGQDIIHTERMSAAQSRIYVLSSLMNEPTAYSLFIRYEIEDTLDIERLRNALTTTMQHHEGLRTCFFVRREDNQPTQSVLSFPVRRFKHVPNATEEDIAAELEAARTKVWDIEHGETLGLTVLSRNSQTHTLVLGYHHIILDASGMRRFIQDLNSSYNMQPLKREGGTCIEFARTEQESLDAGVLKSRMQYWQREYSPLPEVLPLLPMAQATVRQETQQVATVQRSRVLEEDTFAVVRQACKTLGITAFQFCLAVLQVLLAQSLPGIEDLCIGVADSNRRDHDAEFMDTVGFFLNLVPVRFHVPAGMTFTKVAQNTARQIGIALEKSVPFDILLDRLNIARSSSHTPLFQIAMNYRLAMTTSIPFGGSFLTITDGEEGRNPYDISFSFLESKSEGLRLTIDCSESLYGIDGTERLLDLYMGLLQKLASNIDIKVDNCQIYNPEAVSKALKLGHGKRKGVDWPGTISERFQTIHRTYLERVAIRDGSCDLTYQQLATRVNDIATAIHAAGHGIGSRIAVLCEPSSDLVASLLAILHMGAIYVPLDVSLPSSRHVEIISSCHPGLILCDKSTNEIVKQLVLEDLGSLFVLELDKIDNVFEPVPCKAQPNSAAFILYTSGTSGKPKGVVLCQNGIVNWLAHVMQVHDLLDKAPLSILQQSSFGFDMSLTQIFCALCFGGSLVIVPQELRRDPSQITRLIHQKDVACTFAVPSEYLLWLRYGRESLRQSTRWRVAWVGGETFPLRLKRELRRLELPNLSMLEGYGPTEVTFTATSKPVSLDAEYSTDSGSPIGKPHPNYSICILDASCRPLPLEFRGEICIGGPGVALGYWNMSVETDLKFIPDPTTGSGGGMAATSRWYRTGDQGRLAPDGTLIFLGRLGGDTQVKLRGQRIELAEVEGALLKSGESLISTAIVTVRDGDLIAHVILNPEMHINRDTVKTKLLASLPLPQYMHPARVMVMDDLPRSSTGKIDRQAVMKLPLSGSEDAGKSVSGLSLREVELKLLWSRVLPDPSQVLSAESDFFLEGGNSLRLTQLQNEIKENMGVFVSTRDLYSASTLRQMAARLGSESINDEGIDWNVETAIPDSLIAASKEVSICARTPSNRDLKVLLTGATTVLGEAVLQGLLQNPAVDRIHCVAIPPDEEDRLPISGRVISYPGSLSSPELGLSPSECVTLQLDIDIAIHAGFTGHCLNSYTSVRKPNVESTHFLASLCMPRSVPLLYVSSQRVPAMAGLEVLPPVPVLAEPSKSGDTGYMASRWVSERFLHKFSEYHNFMVEIHRPCLYFGDRASPSDAMNSVLQYARLMKCVPRFARVQGYVDFKNVDDIARDMVSSAISLAGSESTGIRYRHHSSGRQVRLEEWPTYMEELYGGTFEMVELIDWIARARKWGIHPFIATYLEGVMEKQESGLFPYLGESL